MSQPSVYLCPSCQEVIRSEGRSREELKCKACGFSLSVKQTLPDNSNLPDRSKSTSSGVMRDIGNTALTSPAELPRRSFSEPIKAKLPDARIEEPPENEDPETSAKKNEKILPDGTRQVRRRKKRRKEKNKILYLLLIGWICVVGAIIWLFKSQDIMDDDQPVSIDDTTNSEPEREKKHRLFLKRYRGAAADAFAKFMNTPVEEGKIQLIDRSSELASEFGRFYQYEAPIALPPGLQIEDIRVVEFAEGKVSPGIEMIWRTRDGHHVEVLALWDGHDWLIDWEHLVRYYSEPWALFKLDAGSSEGVFRLLARKKDVSDDLITEVAFHLPSRPGISEREGVYGRSHSVRFRTKQDLGIEFNRLWSDFNAGERPYNSKFPDGDIRGMMRITVRLAWEDDGTGKREMKLKEIYKPSWYGKRVQEYYKNYPFKPSIIGR